MADDRTFRHIDRMAAARDWLLPIIGLVVGVVAEALWKFAPVDVAFDVLSKLGKAIPAAREPMQSPWAARIHYVLAGPVLCMAVGRGLGDQKPVKWMLARLLPGPPPFARSGHCQSNCTEPPFPGLRP